MKILGIDPGMAIVGYGLIEADSKCEDVILKASGSIQTDKKDIDSKRLLEIYNDLSKIIEVYKPDCASVEELFFFKNQKTVIPVAEARGVIILTAKRYCDKLFEYTPMQIKQALTGNGRAEKKQMQFMVKNVLGLEKVPKPDDAADALAVALCHSQINSMLNNNMI